MPTDRPDWFLAPGIAALGGTRDADGGPRVMRISAVRRAPDGRIVVYVSVPEWLEALTHLCATGAIAATFCRSSDYRTVQLKGRDACVIALPDDERFLAEYIAANTAALSSAIRIPVDHTRRLWSTRAVAVAFTPESAFEGTPGPNAGRELPL